MSGEENFVESRIVVPSDSSVKRQYSASPKDHTHENLKEKSKIVTLN